MNMIVAFRAVCRRIWFHLGQRSFRDALRQWYAKELRGIPSQFTFGQQCNANHALNCKMGGFLTIRHNYIRDYEVNPVIQVHKDIEDEPHLQSINRENIFFG